MLEAASNGMTSKQIAKELGVTANVVNVAIASACAYTGTSNRVELVALALRQKWIR